MVEEGQDGARFENNITSRSPVVICTYNDGVYDFGGNLNLFVVVMMMMMRKSLTIDLRRYERQ